MSLVPLSIPDLDDEDKVQTRLGQCEVCSDKEAKYTCPKCEVKTCCLNCVIIHKKELTCDGIRDRTKFIRMKNFSDTDLLSDYRLLEECARFVSAVKRDEKKKFTRIDKDLPIHLYKLKMAARKRGIVLLFLSQNFTRHKLNSTRYNPKLNLINWRVEWVFPNAEPKPVKFSDEKCSERKRVAELLDRYLNPNAVTFEGSKALIYYKSVGFSGVKILLRAEKVKGSSNKFFEVDPSESLAENLCGKCIVEFPIIFIVLKDHAYNFQIITPEDEFVSENDNVNVQHEDQNKDNQSKFNPHHAIRSHSNIERNLSQHKNSPRPLLTQAIAMEKKKEIEKEIKEQKRKRPRNLLFTTGYSSEESISCSDQDET